MLERFAAALDTQLLLLGDGGVRGGRASSTVGMRRWSRPQRRVSALAKGGGPHGEGAEGGHDMSLGPLRRESVGAAPYAEEKPKMLSRIQTQQLGAVIA